MRDKEQMSLNVTVLDMQPIDPPVGGGRIRLLGLYHNLGFPTKYIGSYDWPGPKYRKHKLSASLTEINVPLSADHFKLNEKWEVLAKGKNVIDTAFPLMAELSKEYTATVRKITRESDVVIFSHPWVYPIVRECLEERKQTIIYDSQNFEGLLRAELLGDNDFGTEIVKEVVLAEFELAHRCDAIMACSSDDCKLYEKIYGVSSDKLNVIPNGVFSQKIVPPTTKQKNKAKTSLNCTEKTALFLASNYEPNIEAVRFIVTEVAPFLPQVLFLICGGVADAAELLDTKGNLSSNVRMVGYIPEEEKLNYLWAADFAVNPMFSGSGTNIKMFDFMSAGLPVISTPIGARGIDLKMGNDPTMEVVDSSEFVNSIARLLLEEEFYSRLRLAGRKLVEEKFSWEHISPEYGKRIVEIHNGAKKGKNRFLESKVSVDEVELEDVTRTAKDSYIPSTHVFGFMSTWGLRCGIAEYSKYFVRALGKLNQQFYIFACKDGNIDNSVPENVIDLKINWGINQVDTQLIVNQCLASSISKLIIQYHKGFFEELTLLDLTEKCISQGIDVYLTLHNTIEMSPECLLTLGNLGPWIVVHNHKEQMRLLAMGISKAIYLPMGIINVPEESKSIARQRFGIKGSPVIGSFGFLRPHKGIAELIEAVSLLKDIYPGIVLLAMNALYPSEDSYQYKEKIDKLILEFGLSDNVLLETDFFEVEEVIQHLHASDIVVLPYHYSSEGASASIATVAAAKRPIIATRQDVFGDLREVVYHVESNSSPVLAASIATVLSSPPLLKNLRENVVRYVEVKGWEEVVNKYMRTINIG